MFKNIKNVLNNENGGPNLENILGIGCASVIILAIWAVGRQLYSYFYYTPIVPTVDTYSDNVVVIGYQR